MYISSSFNRKRNKVIVWERDNGKRIEKEYDPPLYFYIEDKHGEYESIWNKKLKKVSFKKFKDFDDTAKRYKTSGMILYESDIPPQIKILSEKYYNADIPKPNVAYLDIEVNYDKEKGFSSIKDPYAEINSIALYYSWKNSYTLITIPPPGFNIFDKDEFLNKLIDIEPFEENIKINIMFADSEEQLLRWFISEIKDADVVSGWNCINENENIWFFNKIDKIKNAKTNVRSSSYGDIKNISPVKEKTEFIITLNNNQTLSCSKDHVIPFLYKNKDSYRKNTTLFETRHEDTTENIKDKLNLYDCYLLLERHKNNNKDITFRDIILDNIDIFLDHDYFDIILTEDYIQNIIQQNLKVSTNVNRKDFYNHIPKQCCYKRLQKYIKKEYLVEHIKTNDNVLFIFNNGHKVRIDISKQIQNEILQLLGLIYTDGTFWLKDNSFSIYSSKEKLRNNYDLLLKHFSLFDRGWEKSNRKKDNDCRRKRFARNNNILGILYPFIYNTNNKKELNITLLSSLSEKQFSYFFSGLYDGDGHIPNPTPHICNFNNDNTTLQELLLWNGIYSVLSVNKTLLKIYAVSPNKEFIERLNILHPDRSIKDIKFRDQDSSSKDLSMTFNDRYFAIKIDKIEETENKIRMMDIETEDHYFSVHGICVHNSIAFDIPYLGKRLELLGDYYFNKLSFEGAEKPKWRTKKNRFAQEIDVLQIDGRVSIDYMELYKKFEVIEKQSFKLEKIAEEVLPKMRKLEYEGTLADLYKKDFIRFARYNLRDTEILKAFEDKLGYMEVANMLCHMTTAPWSYVDGTLKMAEMAIINFCHHDLNKIVRDNVNAGFYEELNESEEDVEEDTGISGAYVLDPKHGVHSQIGSIDITSLYPSAIRALNASPETILGQFEECSEAIEAIKYNSNKELTLVLENGETITHNASSWKEILKEQNLTISGYGTVFSQKTQGVVPAILTSWFKLRKDNQRLKKEHEKTNYEKSKFYDRIQYIFKIRLNSLYGALVNAFFRFYDKRLGESTTCTGRMILQHQCAEVNRLLGGEYDYSGESIVYGDSVAKDTLINVLDKGYLTIESLYDNEEYDDEMNSISGKEYRFPKDLYVLSYDCDKFQVSYKNVRYIMRHSIGTKKVFRVYYKNYYEGYVDVTEDHSLMVDRNNNIIKCKPNETLKDDILIYKNGSSCSILSVEEIEYNDYVYDIEVEDNHTFFANDVLVHNTDSSYFFTHAKDDETSLKVVNAIEAEINKTYPEFMKNTFFCSDENSVIVKTANDIVASRGIFIDKKRYILRVRYKEGVPVKNEKDALKIMGVELKKTSLPKYIADQLTSYTKRYLEGEEWDTIARDIVNLKEELLNTDDIMLLGLPIGLKKDTKEHEKQFQKHGSDAKMSGNMAAAVHFNECLKNFNDKSIPPLSTGSRIKVFYLTRNYGKFKTIAMPMDIEKLPNWFVDNFEIDRKLHIERLVDNPLNNIFRVVGLVIPEKQDLFLSDLFDMGDSNLKKEIVIKKKKPKTEKVTKTKKPDLFD